MDPVALRSVLRRFPLLGRPRPACPPLTDRVTEVTELAAAATLTLDLPEAAHALNKAALIASDCGLPDLAREWCWRHINTYRQLESLTVTQASYLLEPILNLARLQIRADRGEPAIHLLRCMYQAVTTGSPLAVDGNPMPPLTGLTGSRADLQQLHQWAWLQYLSEGIRVFALAERWSDAVAHATTLNGIGQHLLDGRQAAIIDHLMKRDVDSARTVLDNSAVTQPWEQQVEACLQVLCAEPRRVAAHLRRTMERFLALEPVPGYAVFETRLGVTVAGLADAHASDNAQHVLRRTAAEAIASGDGYAARETLNHGTSLALDDPQQAALSRIVAASGLGARALPDTTLQSLARAVEAAERVLQTPAWAWTEPLRYDNL